MHLEICKIWYWHISGSNFILTYRISIKFGEFLPKTYWWNLTDKMVGEHHMKNIREVNMSTAGVWQLEPEECISNDSTILFFKDAHFWPPEALRKTTTSLHTTTEPTSCVDERNPPPHSQQPFTHWQPLFQPDCTRHSTWVLHLINRTGRLLPDQWRGCGKGQKSFDIYRAREQSTAPESQAQPGTSITHMHRRLGTPTRVNFTGYWYSLTWPPDHIKSYMCMAFAGFHLHRFSQYLKFGDKTKHGRKW